MSLSGRDDIFALLREALGRLSDLERRMDRVDLQRVQAAEDRVEVETIREEFAAALKEIRNLRESLAGVVEP
jgi:hypothetical protein